MKKYYKMITAKWIFIVFAVVLITVILWDTLTTLFTFDVNAPDLAQFGGENVKNQLLKGELRFTSLTSRLNSFGSIFFPILMVALSFSYTKVKKGFLSHIIGKGSNYNKEICSLKLALLGLSAATFLAVYAVILLLSALGGGFEMPLLQQEFASGSILSKMITNEGLYILYYGITKLLGLSFNLLLILSLTDFSDGFIKGSLAYLTVLWVLSPILYLTIPWQFVPMTSMMITSYTNVSLGLILAPFLPLTILTIALPRLKASEV